MQFFKSSCNICGSKLVFWSFMHDAATTASHRNIRGFFPPHIIQLHFFHFCLFYSLEIYIGVDGVSPITTQTLRILRCFYILNVLFMHFQRSIKSNRSFQRLLSFFSPKALKQDKEIKKLHRWKPWWHLHHRLSAGQEYMCVCVCVCKRDKWSWLSEAPLP